MHPQSRFTVEIRTAAERLAVPFQLLRCYVADLKGGVRYHAAGAFEEALNLPSASEAGVENRQRLMASLERLLSIHRADQASERFHQLLTLAADGIHRGESAHLVSVKVKAFLTRLYPALAIYPTTATWFDDTLSSAGYFGFTFKAASTLTASDRRFLKLSAQVMVMMDDCRRVEVPDVPVTAPHAPELASPIVVYSAADWLDVRPSATASAAPARIRLQPKTRPAAMPAASRRASRPPDRPRRLASRWLMGLI
jgi:hypothetical protein